MLNWPLEELRPLAVVVAQLVERLLPTTEVRSSNPVIGNIYIEYLLVNCIEKTKIKKKEAWNDPVNKRWRWGSRSVQEPMSKQILE